MNVPSWRETFRRLRWLLSSAPKMCGECGDALQSRSLGPGWPHPVIECAGCGLRDGKKPAPMPTYVVEKRHVSAVSRGAALRTLVRDLGPWVYDLISEVSRHL